MDAIKNREQFDNLFRFPTVGNGNHRIPFRNHSQVSMAGFCGMQKKGGQSDACKRGCDFSPNQSGFPNPCDHQVFALVQVAHDLDELGIDPAFQSRYSLALNAKNPAGGFNDQPVILIFR